jgi:enoyl-CoA hydratase
VPKPVLGAINGVCVTGGLELALACDVLIASEHARFADTHVRLGLVPAWGMSAFLAQAIGTRKAVELSLTGTFVTADEALQWGLVNHVVPHGRLLARTYEIAASMRDAEPVAARTVLDLYRRATGVPVEDALALEREAFSAWRARRSDG